MLPNVSGSGVRYCGALRADAVVVPMNPLLKERETVRTCALRDRTERDGERYVAESAGSRAEVTYETVSFSLLAGYGRGRTERPYETVSFTCEVSGMTEVAAPRRGRITPEREAELYAAVLDLLREVGYDSLTMDTVAARTRSSKATLYRQWGGKAELVVRAMRHTKPGSIADVDTGSLRGDFHALLSHEDDAAMEQNSALMRGLAMAMHHNPDLKRAFRELLIEPEMDEFSRVLRRAVDRGEVRADNPALDYVVHMLIGAFIARTLIDDRPPTQAFFRAYLDAVVLPVLGV
jgi:AcrR family transcriptional regulator